MNVPKLTLCAEVISMAKKKAHFRGNEQSRSEPIRKHEFPDTTPLIDTGVETLLTGCRSAHELVGTVAAMEAIQTAAEHDVPPPNWAVNAGSKDFLRQSKANPLLRLNAEIREFERWEKVSISELHGDKSVVKCIENAVQLLAGECKAVDGETVRKSYYRVRKRLENSDDQRVIFWIFDRIRQRYESENLG